MQKHSTKDNLHILPLCSVCEKNFSLEAKTCVLTHKIYSTKDSYRQ